MRGRGRTAGAGVAVRRNGVTRLAALALLFSLGACASSAPDALYGLNAPRGLDVAGRAGNRQILVPEPTALQALGTNSIAVVDAGPVYTYFPKAAWSDTLPKVVQAKLIETLENTGRLRGVGRPGESLLIDYQLQTELRAFELRIDGQDRAVVEIMARLVNDRNGQTRASRVFRAEVPSTGTGVAQAVQAMGTAADQVLAELAAWVVGSV